MLVEVLRELELYCRELCKVLRCSAVDFLTYSFSLCSLPPRPPKTDTLKLTKQHGQTPFYYFYCCTAICFGKFVSLFKVP